MNQTGISIGVIFRNEEKNLPACLESLAQCSFDGEMEILLVDNLSTDRSVEVVNNFFRRHPHLSWHLLESSENHLARARNLILDLARYEFIYFTDADCRVLPGTLHRLYEFARFTPAKSFAVVGGSNRPPAQGQYGFYGALTCLQRNFLGNFQSPQMSLALKTKEVSHLPTCNFLGRTEILRRFRFDPRFRITGEDLDLTLRLRQAGWQLFHIPQAEVLHLHPPSFRGWFRKVVKYGYGNGVMMARNRRIFQTHRLLPLYVGTAAAVGLCLAPRGVGIFILLYVLTMFIVARLLNKNRVLTVGFLLIGTHVAYGLGEGLGAAKALAEAFPRLKSVFQDSGSPLV